MESGPARRRPVFAALGKPLFGAHDTPDPPFTFDQLTKGTGINAT